MNAKMLIILNSKIYDDIIRNENISTITDNTLHFS